MTGSGRGRPRPARVLQGIAAAPGIAIGRALLLSRDSAQIFRWSLTDGELEGEVNRLEQAVDQTRKQLLHIEQTMLESSGEQHAFIFEAHRLMLEDDAIIGAATRTIREQKVNAEWALDRACSKMEKSFLALEDAFYRARAEDVVDIHDRVQRNLGGIEGHHDLTDLEEDVVLITHSLAPSEAATLQNPHIVGFITEVGGQASHTAIVAKSLELPAVVGLDQAVAEIEPGSLIAVDGASGQVVVSPNETALKRYVRRRKAYLARDKELIANRSLPGQTTDGVEILLAANIERIEELPSALQHGAQGIGLYRSEFLYLQTTPRLPTEDEHYEAYKELLVKSAPETVIIRTLDLGGEKYFHDVLGPGEANPVLGVRAIRFCRTRPDIIETQLRAILRAAVHGECKLMFPMVSSVEEINEMEEMISRVKGKLRRDKVDFRDDIPLGIMVEVPSIAAIADLIAPRVDFFAIGTNDLTQYTLAVDRGNEHVAHLFQPLHPAVLRFIDMTARAAKRAGIPVSVCGEMAAQPLYAPLLLGLGINQLSMDPVSVPAVKEIIRAVSARESRQLAAEALRLSSATDVSALLKARVSPLLETAAPTKRRRKRPSAK